MVNPTSHSIESHEVETHKDYAHQIIAAFKHLKHGVSYFRDIPAMEAGEEDDMYEIITTALTTVAQEARESERARILAVVEDHYWDSIDKEVALLHLRGILSHTDDKTPTS